MVYYGIASGAYDQLPDKMFTKKEKAVEEAEKLGYHLLWEFITDDTNHSGCVIGRWQNPTTI